MRCPGLLLAGAMLVGAMLVGAAPTGAAPASYAVVAPTLSLRAQAHDVVGAAIVARARAELARPPAPLATIHVEGTLPGKGIADRSIAALRDLPTALDFALAWRLTGEKRFLTAADRYIAAWATTYQPSFNPIDETGFDALIMAYDLTRRDLPATTRTTMDDLLRRMTTGYLERMETGQVVPPQTLTNNWQSHRVKLATLAAFELGDPALIARARGAYEKQVAANLRPDGQPVDFAMRDALHYVVYTLEPLAVATYAARAHGQDWYAYTAPGGASLGRSLDWLAEYANGGKSHVEFAHSLVPFDRQRREAGLAGYQNEPWKPATAAQLYTIASLLDPRFAALRNSLRSADGPARDTIWTLLAHG